MTKLRVAVWRQRAGRVLLQAGLATVLAALAACGGGDEPGGTGADSAELQAIASTETGGQALPTALQQQTTDRPLDVAIDGGGAFVLRDPRNGTLVLSRLGHFDIDAQGRLVNQEGWLVQGLTDGTTPSTLAQLAPLPAIAFLLPPVATSQVVLEANLDVRSSSVAPGSALDIDDPRSYTNATSAALYDQLGQQVSLNFYFRKMADSVWHVHAYANGKAVRADVDGRPRPVAELTFRADGSAPINSAATNKALPAIVIDIPVTDLASGSASAAIAAVQLDLSALTAVGSVFNVSQLRQNGAPAARLSSASVRATGELVLNYDDTRFDDSRRLLLARTTTADRLHRYGPSGWICGRGCASPMVALPGQMLTGFLVPGALNAVY